MTAVLSSSYESYYSRVNFSYQSFSVHEACISLKHSTPCSHALPACNWTLCMSRRLLRGVHWWRRHPQRCESSAPTRTCYCASPRTTAPSLVKAPALALDSPSHPTGEANVSDGNWPRWKMWRPEWNIYTWNSWWCVRNIYTRYSSCSRVSRSSDMIFTAKIVSNCEFWLCLDAQCKLS